MKKMRSSKGFTLIELLVVIAIIGILSSVVLASLTTARSRGTAAAVQNEVSNVRAQMELFYSTNGNSYGVVTTQGTCGTGPFAVATVNGAGGLVAGMQSKGATVTCYATATAWAVSAVTGGSTFCADSTGVSTTSASLSGTDFSCL